MSNERRRGRARFVAFALTLTLTAVPLAAAVLPTTLTLDAPAYVAVGATALFTGHYQATALGLASTGMTFERVHLHVDGSPVASANANPLQAGRYVITHAFAERGTYAVHAVADDGGLGEARSRTVTVHAAVPPSPPLDLVAAPVADEASIQLTWSAPGDNGGAPITQYRVEQRTSSSSSWAPRDTVGSGTTSFTITGLDVGTSYQHRVIAVNPIGVSPASDPASVPAGGAPPAPALSVAPVDRSFDVDVVLAKTGELTQGFILQRSLNDGASWHTVAKPAGASASLRVSAGFPTTGVLLRAAAASFGGVSPYTTVTPSGDLPGVPMGFTATLRQSLGFEWSPPTSGGPLQGFALFDNGEPLQRWNGDKVELPYSYSTHETFSLTPGTHSFTVAATSAAGVGPHSPPVHFTLETASQPVALTSTVIEGNRNATIQLDWAPPADSGGAPLLGYTLRRVSPPGGPWVNLSPTATSYSLVTSPDVTLSWELVARTIVGEGAPATVTATVEDFDLVLTVALSHFSVCETDALGWETCASVPSGGTYTRTGSGDVRHGPVYAGTFTKRGVPIEGEVIRGYVVRDYDHHTISSLDGITNATGDYVMVAWPQTSSLSGASCSTIPHEFRWHAGDGGPTETTDMLVLCP